MLGYYKMRWFPIVSTVALAFLAIWMFGPTSGSGGKYVMYSKSTCGWCKKQKAELGSDISKVKVVDCDSGCKGVDAFPTWEINGVRSSGFKTKAEIFG